jgi:hypothetical protein
MSGVRSNALYIFIRAASICVCRGGAAPPPPVAVLLACGAADDRMSLLVSIVERGGIPARRVRQNEIKNDACQKR